MSNEWSDSFVGARDHVQVTIDIPGPRPLHVVSTHFKAGDTVPDLADRVSQAQELTNYIATAGFASNDYLVVCGDLNLSNIDESCFTVLTNQAVTGAHRPTDQNGDPDTNLEIGRAHV